MIGGPGLGPAPAFTLHIRLGPDHLRSSPGRCLLLPWCLGPAGRMEQDPKPPRLRLWALLPWLPRKGGGGGKEMEMIRSFSAVTSCAWPLSNPYFALENDPG